MRLAYLGGKLRGSEASTQVKFHGWHRCAGREEPAGKSPVYVGGQGVAFLPGRWATLTSRWLEPAARFCDFKFERFLVLCFSSFPRRPLSLPQRELSGRGLGADVGGGDILGAVRERPMEEQLCRHHRVKLPSYDNLVGVFTLGEASRSPEAHRQCGAGSSASWWRKGRLRRW